MADRLTDTAALNAGVAVPGYDRDAAKAGIVHLGTGAFHKAHEAVYTDGAMAASGGDWMITGVSLRSADVADALNPQNGLYTLLVRGPDGVSPRVIGSVREVLVAPRGPEQVIQALAREETKIVSLTITEKGYGLDPRTGGLDRDHPAIAADLNDPRRTVSALGFIVAGLRLRMMKDYAPFTVLCCDNLQNNGRVLRRLVLEFAEARDPKMVAYIRDRVTFPSTMVDRITPASTPQTFADVERLVGRADLAAVETEPFTQWIVEDDFVSGRPDWEAAGAVFVSDVAPYEKMKLRMLNGAHSTLAYAGYMAGHAHVRDVMGDADLVAIIGRHMAAAAATLDPVPGIELADYARDLRLRFANPAIAHQTYQIAMDGTQKLPQRLLEPALVALERGQSLEPFAFSVAAWMRYAVGRRDDGESHALRDPREAEIGAAAAGAGGDARALATALFDLPGLFPARLVEAGGFADMVVAKLDTMLRQGMRAAIAAEAVACRG
ncbi:mannitol dehydrogenase family protein [Aquibium carbonis]|uniref:Mannitol dehydrogenase family protein n=1 Tax=Aquibium carbonis TaxID=2495581 RepID=A0A429YSG3_9HYPH|nr:mannitol dehydrogenase family protein [Aquibium carbonis]RST84360.1 mannitol dehydrogenase family protein [Aquibium carbonis]